MLESGRPGIAGPVSGRWGMGGRQRPTTATNGSSPRNERGA